MRPGPVRRLARLLARPPQLMAPFVPGDPQSGYYNDLREKGLEHGDPAAALAAARLFTASRQRVNAVTVAQLGLGSWQLAQDDDRWLDVVEHAATWVRSALDEQGRIAYFFAMPHTYHLDPPWYCAMAQGEAASLLVRAARSLDESSLLDAAARAVESLVDDGSMLVRQAPEGPILQEYPTVPPADVLNGWIFALWGLYDVAVTLRDDRARNAFENGTRALSAVLPRYDVGLDWSRYDLVPRRIPNVASPFYHRLHVEQLRALACLAPEHGVFAATAERWLSALRRPPARAHALLLKGLFRIGEPRRSGH
jgi:heparosan-N-sulfate-glucuronate 5-epimerase